jgi:hypothetical protein
MAENFSLSKVRNLRPTCASLLAVFPEVLQRRGEELPQRARQTRMPGPPFSGVRWALLGAGILACPNTLTGCYGFSPSRIVGVATQTIQRCVERMNRAYEQGADAVRVGEYVRRRWAWVGSGLAEDVALRTFVNTPHPVQSPFVVVDQGRSPSIAKHPVPSGIVLGGFGYSVWF